MAKTPNVNNPDPSAVAPPAINAATPENTPVPGGGSWRWNGAGWTANEPYAPPVSTVLE